MIKKKEDVEEERENYLKNPLKKNIRKENINIKSTEKENLVKKNKILVILSL